MVRFSCYNLTAWCRHLEPFIGATMFCMNGSKGILRYFYSTWIKTEISCSFVQPLRIGCGSGFICALHGPDNTGGIVREGEQAINTPLTDYCLIECSLASYAYDYADYNPGYFVYISDYADQIGDSKYLNWTLCEWYCTWHKRKLNSQIEIFFWHVNISCNSLFLHAWWQ